MEASNVNGQYPIQDKWPLCKMSMGNPTQDKWEDVAGNSSVNPANRAASATSKFICALFPSFLSTPSTCHVLQEQQADDQSIR